jgi:putative peptidoglycan lipid II flippase
MAGAIRMGGADQPPAAAGGPEETRRQSPSSNAVLQHSMTGAVGTVASRLTGLAKTLVVGAVLGATYLGNTYQAVNSVPNLVYYSLLAGSLFVSLLVPPLVAHVDEGDRRRARRLANGFLGSLLLITGVASGLLLALGPLITHGLSLGAPDPATAAAQSRVGWLLLALFVPQIALYVVAGTGAAVQNAYGRFGLAAAAPALESLGIIVVLAAVAVLYGTGVDLLQVSDQQLLLLGAGTTAAVGLHAACQWLGARASGPALVPGAGWRDPEVRRILRRIVPALAFTALAACEMVVILVVANRVAGGLVVFQLALNFYYLPTALVTWPTSRALLPQLARLHHAAAGRQFRDELLRAVAVASFVIVPIAVGYLALSGRLGHLLAVGELQRGGGPELFALSLAALAPGVVGDTWFTLGTYAFYAQQDVRSPLRSMGVRVAVSLSCMTLAWLARGPAVLVLLGCAVSLGSLIGAAHVGWRLRARLPRGEFGLLRPLAKTMAASAIMAAAVLAVTLGLRGLPSTKPAQLLVMAAAGLTGAGVFLGVQAAWGAAELTWLRRALARGGASQPPEPAP